MGIHPRRSRVKALTNAFNLARLVAKYAMKPPQTRDAWITFDDGPHPVHTPSMLDTLRRHNMRATFFWVGHCAEQHPEIVRRAVAEGHFIGNHSYSHPFLTRLNRVAIQREIVRADEVLSPFSHQQGAKLFRPPHCDHDAVVDEVTAAAGYQTILWNLSTRDWNRPFQPQRWVRLGSFLAHMTESSVVLMHADLPGTAAHLDDFLMRLRRLEVRFMPPETLLESWLSGRFASRHEAFRTENLIQSTQR